MRIFPKYEMSIRLMRGAEVDFHRGKLSLSFDCDFCTVRNYFDSVDFKGPLRNVRHRRISHHAENLFSVRKSVGCPLE